MKQHCPERKCPYVQYIDYILNIHSSGVYIAYENHSPPQKKKEISPLHKIRKHLLLTHPLFLYQGPFDMTLLTSIFCSSFLVFLFSFAFSLFSIPPFSYLSILSGGPGACFTVYTPLPLGKERAEEDSTHQHLHLVEVLGFSVGVLHLLGEDQVELEEEHTSVPALPD
jgi:hypothetical protein